MANTLTLTIQNPAAGNKAIVFIGVTAVLNVTLQNDTGEDITMDGTSVIEIYMPYYFTSAEVGAMVIDAISQPDWSFSFNNTPPVSLLLKYTGAAGTWKSGAVFSFNITTVLSTGDPDTDSVQLNFTNLKGKDIPMQLGTPLALNNPVVVKDIDLDKVLQVNLDNQGTVFVSAEHDDLTNTIYLNLKNATNTPLYDGKSMWTGKPKVTVTFVYGTTSGSLAPDQKSESSSAGSAWNISGNIYVDQTAGWSIANPKVSGQEHSPAWQLTPNNTNLEILGIDDKSNVTFAFTNIISLTPAGNTQMYVQFSGFTKNDQTKYNDHLFVLNISKLKAPITRGLVNFFSTESIIPLSGPIANIKIPLRWAMYYVDRILLTSNMPGPAAKLIDKPYIGVPPVNSDLAPITVPSKITQDTTILLTLQAFDGTGGFLNAMQFSVFLAANFFVDPRDQKVYPTVYINNQTWMAANLDYQAPSGSVPYDNNTGNEETYGMLYTAPAALANIPAGWRLPTLQDWADLIASQDKDKTAYDKLIAGGNSQFNARLGGYGDNIPSFHNGPGDPNGQTEGNYWSSTPDEANTGYNFYALFNEPNKTVNTRNSNPGDFFLSVRYVKNN